MPVDQLMEATLFASNQVNLEKKGPSFFFFLFQWKRIFAAVPSVLPKGTKFLSPSRHPLITFLVVPLIEWWSADNLDAGGCIYVLRASERSEEHQDKSVADRKYASNDKPAKTWFRSAALHPKKDHLRSTDTAPGHCFWIHTKPLTHIHYQKPIHMCIVLTTGILKGAPRIFWCTNNATIYRLFKGEKE